RGQWRQPELAAPARGPLDGHHRAAGRGRQHGPVQRDADHDEGGDVALAVGLVDVLVVQADQQEQRDGDDQREDDGPPVAGEPPDLQREGGEVEPAQARRAPAADVGHDGVDRAAHRRAPSLLLVWSSPSPVSAMKASSMPRAVISRSLALVRLSRYLATSSLSRAWIRTVSPRSSTLSTPGSSRSSPSLAPGNVARIERPADSALISAAVPSATTWPCRSRMMRSA